MSIEKIITLVWDEEHEAWFDKYSHGKITVIPPAMTLRSCEQPPTLRRPSWLRRIIARLAGAR